jgi:hypothetical protein
MSDASRSLHDRIDSLERQNRRMRWFGGAALASVTAAVLMSFAAPAVCKTVWGERFVLRDGHGKERMVLNAYGTNSPSLTVKDETGRSVAELAVGENGEMNLSVFKEGRLAPAGFHFGSEDQADGEDGACCDAKKGDKDKSVN